MYDIRGGSLMNIYAKIVVTLKPIEEWGNWCVSKGIQWVATNATL